MAVSHYCPWQDTQRTQVVSMAVGSDPGEGFRHQESTFPASVTGTIITKARPLIPHTWGFNHSMTVCTPELLLHALTSIPLGPEISPQKGRRP